MQGFIAPLSSAMANDGTLGTGQCPCKSLLHTRRAHDQDGSIPALMPMCQCCKGLNGFPQATAGVNRPRHETDREATIGLMHAWSRRCSMSVLTPFHLPIVHASAWQ